MSSSSLALVGVGNAIVDVIATVDESFIIQHGLTKGVMTLVDAERADALYAAMPPAVEVSGGSAANTMVGLASFGAASSYIGKVRDDQLGAVFSHDITAAGVRFAVPPAPEGAATARCLIQVTPDAERTMNTYLGISSVLAPDDVDADLVAQADIVYCEGYLWDTELAKAAIRKAMTVGREHGAVVSMTLSDGFCVDRHRGEWLDLLTDQVDLVFANEEEVCSLFESDDVERAMDKLASLCQMVVVTRGAKGSRISTDGIVVDVPAVPVEHLVDTTGAGDLYAAGFLYGLANGMTPERCGTLGSAAASEVISHMGARPHISLATLL
ncbi:MAG: adenosine kinase [Acidimicrobiia bacterium]|nr:adenosine kinase [Acidimicrobiia bacterium]MDH5236395.1 adenosine kinase [Acidimicrobiia bacterium]